MLVGVVKFSIDFGEKFEDTKVVIKSRTSKKDCQ